jgi:hypothetical protein
LEDVDPEQEKAEKPKPVDIPKTAEEEPEAQGDLVSQPSAPQVVAQRRQRRKTSTIPTQPSGPVVDPGPTIDQQRQMQDDIIILPGDDDMNPHGFYLPEKEVFYPTQPKRVEDGAFDLLFRNTLGATGNDGETPNFPLLRNLSRYWQQKAIAPVLPFACGNPNTAARDAFQFTDSDLAGANPVMRPVVFAEMANGKDLMTRFQRAWIDLTGINPIPGRYANRDDEDILQRVPQKVRRASF